jgi:hypothetical protein
MRRAPVFAEVLNLGFTEETVADMAARTDERHGENWEAGRELSQLGRALREYMVYLVRPLGQTCIMAILELIA